MTVYVIRGGALVELSWIVGGPVMERVIEAAGTGSIDVVAAADGPVESCALAVAEPVVAARTSIGIVIVFMSGENPNVQTTVPLTWPDCGVVGHEAGNGPASPWYATSEGKAAVKVYSGDGPLRSPLYVTTIE